MNGTCANYRLSQRRGSPQSRVPKLCPRGAFLAFLARVAKRKISNLQILRRGSKNESLFLRQISTYFNSMMKARGEPLVASSVST